jgi:dynactin complex subunit
VEEIECEVDRLRGENGHLRQENRELNEVLFQKMNEINSEKKIRLFEEIASHRSAAAAD